MRKHEAWRLGITVTSVSASRMPDVICGTAALADPSTPCIRVGRRMTSGGMIFRGGDCFQAH
jgi:hypothetical protein